MGLTELQKRRIERQDDASIKRCRECGKKAVWRDEDLKQEFCYNCHSYLEASSTGQYVPKNTPVMDWMCPECGASVYRRKTMSPEYRCLDGHEINTPPNNKGDL